jgi:hypothetical protein
MVDLPVGLAGSVDFELAHAVEALSREKALPGGTGSRGPARQCDRVSAKHDEMATFLVWVATRGVPTRASRGQRH